VSHCLHHASTSSSLAHVSPTHSSDVLYTASSWCRRRVFALPSCSAVSPSSSYHVSPTFTAQCNATATPQTGRFPISTCRVDMVELSALTYGINPCRTPPELDHHRARDEATLSIRRAQPTNTSRLTLTRRSIDENRGDNRKNTTHDDDDDDHKLNRGKSEQGNKSDMTATLGDDQRRAASAALASLSPSARGVRRGGAATASPSAGGAGVGDAMGNACPEKKRRSRLS
jgi:hypothetical protein